MYRYLFLSFCKLANQACYARFEFLALRGMLALPPSIPTHMLCSPLATPSTTPPPPNTHTHAHFARPYTHACTLCFPSPNTQMHAHTCSLCSPLHTHAHTCTHTHTHPPHIFCVTHTQTHRHTDRQPGIFRPERSQYIQSMK